MYICFSYCLYFLSSSTSVLGLNFHVLWLFICVFPWMKVNQFCNISFFVYNQMKVGLMCWSMNHCKGKVGPLEIHTHRAHWDACKYDWELPILYVLVPVITIVFATCWSISFISCVCIELTGLLLHFTSKHWINHCLIVKYWLLHQLYDSHMGLLL